MSHAVDVAFSFIKLTSNAHSCTQKFILYYQATRYNEILTVVLYVTVHIKRDKNIASGFRLRTPISTKQAQLENLKIVRQQVITAQAEGRLAVIIYHYVG